MLITLWLHRVIQEYRRNKLEDQIRQLFFDLIELDFSQPPQVVDWLEQMLSMATNPLVTVDPDLVLDMFRQAGFQPNMRTDDYRSENDRHYFEWLVGQGLCFLKHREAADCFPRLANQWRAHQEASP